MGEEPLAETFCPLDTVVGLPEVLCAVVIGTFTPFCTVVATPDVPLLGVGAVVAINLICKQYHWTLSRSVRD